VILILVLAISAISIGAFRIWTVHDITYSATFTSHYEAVTSAAVRIAGGETCLAEVLPQYGCYGEYLAPALRFIGTSTLAVTSLFAVLQIISVAVVIVFARSLIRLLPVLLACVLCLIIEVVLNNQPETNDPILQYYPIRFLFPALSLAVACWAQRRFNWPRSALAGAFSAVAITWNLESGLAVCVSLAAFVCLGDFASPVWSSTRNILAGLLRGLSFAAAAIGTLAVFILYLYVKSHGDVNIAGYFVFQKTFYLTGFGMILIPPFPDYWTVHFAIIFVVLLFVVLSVSATQGAPDQAMGRVAYLAVLASGLSLYFSGRSHPLVLRLASWPDAILFFFLVDRAVREATHFTQRGALAALTVCTAALPAAYLAIKAPALWKLGANWRSGIETEVEQDVKFIASHTHPGEPVGIFALNEGVLYGETGTRSALVGPGVAEMIRRADLAQTYQHIMNHGPEKLFLGAALETAADTSTLGTNIPLDFSSLRQAYALAEWGPDNRLLYLRRKPFPGRDLFTLDGAPLTWSGPTPQFAQAWDDHDGQRWGRSTLVGLNVAGIEFGGAFGLRIRVVPAPRQADDAILISSIYGANDGFSIQRAPSVPEGYIVLLGNGSSYWASKPFVIPAGRESDVVVSFDGGKLHVSRDGIAVIDESGLGSLKPALKPVTIGGWWSSGRRFAGEIREVEIFNRGVPGI
jgi:hypothetical protein